MIDLPHAARRRRGPRVALLVLGVLLVLVLLGGVVVAVKLPNASTDFADPPRGSLEVAVPARGDWPVGEFRIRLRDSLQIRHPDAAAHVWESPDEEAFLTAGTGDPWIIDDHGIVRVSDRLRESWPDQRIDSAGTDEEGAFVLVGTLSGSAGSIPYTLRFAPTESRLDVSVEVEAPADRIYLSAGLEPDEGVHGFGAQSAAWNLRGERIALLPREQGIGRGEQPLSFFVDMAESAAGGQDTTYYVSGVNVTDRSRSFAYRGDAVASADLRPDDRMVWEVWDSAADFSLAAAATPRAAVAIQSGWTGPFIGAPAWAGTGLIAGLQGGTDAVREKVATLQEAGVPLAAVWLQDWTGPRATPSGDRQQWNWTLDDEHYAGWDELAAELGEQGIRILTYVNPMLSADSGEVAVERGGRDLHTEAAELGYLVVDSEGEVLDVDQRGFTAASVDLSNPEAREWLAQAIADEAVARGVSGWMADFAEGPPIDAEIEGADAIDWRVRWPGLWQEVNNRALELSELGGAALVWYRSGGTRSAGVPVWIGDQTQDWSRADGLASTVPIVHSLSASGVAAVHGDIGGYTSVALPLAGDAARDDELFVRWAEASLLQPVFRTHEGNRPDAAAQPATDPALAEQVGLLARLFAALKLERDRLAATGAMALAAQHPWMMNPTQHRLQTGAADDQLQLGPDLLLAPVLEPGKDSVAVTLPPGRWRHLWSGRIYGNEAGVIQAVVPAPVGEPAIFAREGTSAQSDFAAFLAAEEERAAAAEEAEVE